MGEWDQGDFRKFQSVFDMDQNPHSNFLQYYIANRQIYANWCKVFCKPCLYKKLRKENANLTEGPTDFSKVDKYIIAYGKQAATFTQNTEAYIDYWTHLPIETEAYSKIDSQFTENISVNAPYDDRFDYTQGDLIIFKINEYLFRFKIVDQPESYAGILYKLNLKYIDKYKTTDLTQKESEPERQDECEYW
ncbi:MAG: hypothetical protein MJZ34_02860 [Paludibacteraceae bacterium]|nr:hypothetical protein [Paludibacteraceae bacterium]